MISFRKGAAPVMKSAASETSTASAPVAAISAAPVSSGKNWNPDNIINLEWWQTPDKFKRRAVDDLECDLINVIESLFSNNITESITHIICFQSGGADRIYQ